MKTYIAYCDGSIIGNGRPDAISGSATLIENEKGEQRFLISLNQTQATSNKAEMIAAIQALNYITKPAKFIIYSDSEYLVTGFMSRLDYWETNGWSLRNGKEVSNIEYWQDLAKLRKFHKIEMRWVKGHDTDAKQNLVDVLARTVIYKWEKFKKESTYLGKKLICM